MAELRESLQTNNLRKILNKIEFINSNIKFISKFYSKDLYNNF